MYMYIYAGVYTFISLVRDVWCVLLYWCVRTRHSARTPVTVVARGRTPRRRLHSGCPLHHHHDNHHRYCDTTSLLAGRRLATTSLLAMLFSLARCVTCFWVFHCAASVILFMSQDPDDDKINIHFLFFLTRYGEQVPGRNKFRTSGWFLRSCSKFIIF